MARLSRLGLVAALLVVGLGAAPPAALPPRIDAVLEEARSADAFWGLYVHDLTTGEALYERQADHRFLPASNQKVLTAATALEAFGADYRFATRLTFDGRVDGGTLRGDLVVRGSGDPTFGSSEIGPSADPLEEWAERLAASGVRRIEGRLVGDDDAFDEQPYAEGWDIDYVTTQSSRYLGVSTGGLSYRDNLIKLHLRGGLAGRAPEVTTSPRGALTVHNEATTSARRRGRAINVERLFGTDEVIVSGSVPANSRSTVNVPATDPTLMTLRSLHQALEEAGIDVGDLQMVDVDELERRPDPDDGRLLFVHYSPPMTDILAVVLKESNNFYADQLFRAFGYGGSADGGENRVKALVERSGARPGVLSARDGSGLSRKDMITPAAMGQVLAYMDRHQHRDAFRAALPAGGEAQSTLEYRLQDVPVVAKTGSIEFVRALSGYVTTADGHEVAFAIFANHYDAPSYLITHTIDRVVRVIADTAVG